MKRTLDHISESLLFFFGSLSPWLQKKPAQEMWKRNEAKVSQISFSSWAGKCCSEVGLLAQSSQPFDTKNEENVIVCSRVHLFLPFRLEWPNLNSTLLFLKSVLLYAHACTHSPPNAPVPRTYLFVFYSIRKHLAFYYQNLIKP